MALSFLLLLVMGVEERREGREGEGREGEGNEREKD